MPSNEISKPAKQAAGVSPISGVAPPVATQFKKGQSGNPKGRPPAGLSIREWLNTMQDWSVAEIQKLIRDPKATVAQKSAARIWIAAASKGGTDFDRIMDRTEGKAKQVVDLTTCGEPIQTGFDLSRLERDELRSLRETLAKAKASEN